MPKCTQMEKLNAKLEQYEQYRQFIIYKDKILALGNDSLEKTIAIAVALCLVCAVLVSFAAVALKPLQVGNKAADMKKNILEVAGLLEEGANINKEFSDIFKGEPQYIPKDTPCLVRDDDFLSWKLAYSNGDGNFRTYGIKSSKWNHVQVLDINNLPKF